MQGGSGRSIRAIAVVATFSRRAPDASALQGVQPRPHARHPSVVYAVLYPPQRRRPVVRRHVGLRRGRRQVVDEQLPPRGRHHQRLPHCPVGGGGRGGKSHRFDHRRRVGRGSGALQQRRDGTFRARQRSQRRGRPTPAPTPRSARWRRGAASRAVQLAPAPLTPAPLRPAFTTAAVSEAVGVPPTPWLAVEKSVGPHGRQHPRRGAPVVNGRAPRPTLRIAAAAAAAASDSSGAPAIPTAISSLSVPPSRPRAPWRRQPPSMRPQTAPAEQRRPPRQRPRISAALKATAPPERHVPPRYSLQCGVRPAVAMSRPRFIRCPG